MATNFLLSSGFSKLTRKSFPSREREGKRKKKNRENGAGVCSLNGDRMVKILRNDSSTTLFLAYLDNFLGKQAPLSCDDDDASFIEKLGEGGGCRSILLSSSIIDHFSAREERRKINLSA